MNSNDSYRIGPIVKWHFKWVSDEKKKDIKNVNFPKSMGMGWYNMVNRDISFCS